ncbi:MAG: hypothetical protein OFPI_09550 [Osedax symbiont Rs2]|nr:MAG: hypothetical protein OFPI_09550 [Osedax symbiont Rs2]
MLGSLSIQTRFLIAPIIGVLLTLILYVTSNQVIQDNALLFHDISKSNVVQISEISEITLLITESNSEIVTLLLESDKLDEEGIYVEGKIRLNHIYQIEEKLNKSIGVENVLTINGENIYKQVNVAFSAYKSQIISSIEMSSVDIKQASYELVLANEKLKVLNDIFLKLTKYYSTELSQQAASVEDNLYKKTYITELTSVLLILMLWSAYYFSKNTSANIHQVHKALLSLSQGHAKITIPRNKDTYIQDIWNAVSEFKESIRKQEIYKNELLMQQFAFDQHAIIARTDIKGTITSVNAKFCDISGYSSDELIGNNHRIINSGYHPKKFWCDMYKTISKGSVWHSEILNKSKDGTTYWVDTSIIPITSVTNEIVGYISIRTDITEKKSQHQKLINANIIAEEATAAKSSFLANMSHEIRTPMNGVYGTLKLLKNEPISPKGRNFIELAEYSCKSLLTIINDILDFSKIEAGKLQIESIDFSVIKMVNSVSTDMLTTAQSKKIDFDIINNLSHDNWTGDPVRVGQILINLLSNAIKFTQHGKVTLLLSQCETDDREEAVRIEVIDTGIGMNEEGLNKLFTQFAQADDSTVRNFGGTGLGMSIVESLVHLMKGEINANSQIGEGTSIRVILPLPKAEVDSLNNKNEELPFEMPNLSGKYILIAEDNRVNQIIIEANLKPSNAKLKIVSNGEEAVREAFNERPDIILMDIQMPVMDGICACKEILAQMESMPIIALTANVMSEDITKYRETGFVESIGKPFEVEDLFAKIKRHI